MNRNAWLAVGGIATLTIAVLVAWWVTTEASTGVPEVPLPVAVSFSFDEGGERWEPGFAGIPSDPSELGQYELQAEWRELPDSLGRGGLFSRGSNHSDDLVMYWIKEVEGLVPATRYDIQFELEVATNVPGGLVGIGGSPTESVYIKVGASTDRPVTESAADGFERLTIDLGSQSQDGADGGVIGTLENPNVDIRAGEPFPYALNLVASAGFRVSATTDDRGSLWVIAAIDSGFEGATDIYYSAISIELTPAG